MSRADQAQLNVRSAFARDRANELAKSTGMTVAQIVEDALRGYVPPGSIAEFGGMVRRGPILVLAANGPTVTLNDAESALNEVRERDLER